MDSACPAYPALCPVDEANEFRPSGDTLVEDNIPLSSSEIRQVRGLMCFTYMRAHRTPATRSCRQQTRDRSHHSRELDHYWVYGAWFPIGFIV